MVRDGRCFFCGTCGNEVWICTYCDRGHRYCSPECSLEARRKSCAESRRKHQEKEEGRLGNARRQREWYSRRKSLEKTENLTDQGSVEPGSPSIILAEKAAESCPAPPREISMESRLMQRLLLIEIAAHLMEIQDEPPSSSESPRCHICGCSCREASSPFDQGCP
jgi:hypothetical protein